MTATRLVLITRRFWPLMGGAEIVMARLAQSFQTQGHDVTILTACWHEDWPMQVDHHGVRVIHMAQSESPDGHISITMLVELADYLSEEGL